VRGLQAAGRIAISERKIRLTKDGQRFTVTEYRALGLTAEQAGDDEDYSGAELDEAAAA
jgi:hypothetical protein